MSVVPFMGAEHGPLALSLCRQGPSGGDTSLSLSLYVCVWGRGREYVCVCVCVYVCVLRGGGGEVGRGDGDQWERFVFLARFFSE